jgi:hypothetical protein
MAKPVALILGIGFIAVALIGFLFPAFLGMHLSLTHSIIHLVTGIVSIYFGTVASPGAARMFCIIFGVVYGGLGLAGFLFGTQAVPNVPGPAGPHILQVIPGHFEVGTADHIVHIVLGAIYLIGGLTTRTTPAAAHRQASEPVRR